MTANIRTPQRTVSAMQRFAVSQKNHAEAITISPFLLSLPYRTENRRFSALSCTKTGGTQPKLSAACFVVQSCLADADFVVFSNYCLIGTRPNADVFSFLFFRRSAAPNATPKQRLSKRLHHGTISQPPKYICQNRIRLGAQFLQKAFCSLPSGRVPGIP